MTVNSPRQNQNSHRMIATIGKTLLAAVFFIVVAGTGARSQDLTLREIPEVLLANPPVHGDSSIRRNCFRNLDRILKNIDPASGDVRFFQSEMRQTLWKEISDPASGHAVIYKMYNHGFIVKLQEITIAFDLAPMNFNWAVLPRNILENIDILLISHEHSDHFGWGTVSSLLQLGRKVIVPQELDHPGTIKLAGGDSLEIYGVKIKAYDGLHSVPVRIYEVTTPLGIKIMHTGDNQTSETLPEGIEDLDILFLNSWVNESDGSYSNVTGMYNCLQKLKPRLMIPGHCNELWHAPEQRYPYDSVFTLKERHVLSSEVRVLAWGEKTIYKPDAIQSIQKTFIQPVIDGQFDPIWTFVPEMSMKQILLEEPADWNDLHGKFRTLWDEKNIYLFLSVRDDTLRTDHPDAWNNDVVEIYFDGDNSKNDPATGYDSNDLQIRYTYMGDSWQAPSSEFAFHKTRRGYDFEAKIPAADLNFVFSDEMLIGMDVQVTDNDKGMQNTLLRWWSNSPENWRWPGLFGTAKLMPTVQKPELEVFYSLHPVAIDGVLDDVWVGRDWKEMNHTVKGEENLTHPGDLNVRWNSLWHTDTLYYIMEVLDDSLVADDDLYWQDDCVEFWLDGDNSKGDTHDGINDLGFQFRYNPSLGIDLFQSIGPAVDLKEIRQAAKPMHGGWRVEVAFPLDILGIAPYDSIRFGMDLDYNDDDSGGERESKKKVYATFDTAWHHPVDWGTAMLVGSGKSEPTVHTPEPRKPELICRIFPNPVAGKLNIHLENMSGDQAHIRISNLGGLIVYEKLLRHKPGDFFTSLAVDNMIPGIYLVSIQTTKKFFIEKVIVIGK